MVKISVSNLRVARRKDLVLAKSTNTKKYYFKKNII